MSERYTKLFSLGKNLYTYGSPVIVSAGALLKDNKTQEIIAQLKLASVDKGIHNKTTKYGLPTY